MSFWKNRLMGLTLEEIVGKLKEFKEEFVQWADEKQEAVKQTTKIQVYYHPGKELSVYLDGNKVVSPDVSRAQFERLAQLKEAGDAAGIVTLLCGKQEEVKEEGVPQEVVAEKVHQLVETGDFEVRGNSVYMKGIDRSLPSDMVDYFVANLDERDLSYMEEDPKAYEIGLKEEYEALKKFWYWVVMNPKTQVIDQLFTFLKKNYLRLNKNGFFYALRNIVTVAPDTELVKLISEQYVRVKGWRKDPSQYSIYKKDIVEEVEEPGYYDEEEDEDGDIEEFWVEGKTIQKVVGRNFRLYEPGEAITEGWEKIGDLESLYQQLPEMEGNRYTDAYTKSFDIRIGKKVWMDPEKCSWSDVDCGEAGLHFTMSQIHYVGCGDTSVIMCINPAKVVGIGSHKGRCYEYLPICTIPRDQANDFLRDGDFNSLGIEDKSYQEEMATLEATVKQNFVIEKERYSYTTYNAATSTENVSSEQAALNAVAYMKGRINPIV